MARHGAAASEQIKGRGQISDPDEAEATESMSIVEMPDTDAAEDDSLSEDNSEGSTESAAAKSRKSRRPWSPARLALTIGFVMMLVCAGLVGWFAHRGYQAHQVEQQRAQFLQVGRQSAINVTSIDYRHADADVRRIVDSSTGTLYESFERRAQPFVDLVQKTQSITVGTVSEAGLESVGNEEAQVLVIMRVKRTIGGVDQPSLGWRMRISLQRLDNKIKCSNVEFVP